LLPNTLDVYSHKAYSILVPPTRYQRADSWTIGRPLTKKERFGNPMVAVFGKRGEMKRT
jgi:hypothetical protein